MSPGGGFSGPLEPVTVDGDGDDVSKVVLGDELGHEDTDPIEPALDE